MSSYSKSIFLYSMLFFFAAACLFKLEMGNSVALFDMSSFFIIAFSVIAMLFATGRYKDFKNAIASLFSNNTVFTPQEKGEAVKLFKLLGKTVYCTAALLAFMSFISIMVNFREENIASDMYISITAILYALLINLVFIYPAIGIFESAGSVRR